MSRRLLKPSVAVALGLCSLALAPQAGAAARPVNARPAANAPLGGINLEGLGANSTPAQADSSIAIARSLHAKVVRIELPWAVLEPNVPGQLNPRALPYLDRFFSDAAARGIKVIALVDITPCWASAAPEEIRHGCAPGSSRGETFRWPPANPADFAGVVRRLAERYGNSLSALEVWNEPDQANEKYFAGPNKPERYAAILKAAYTAIKQVDPNITVLAGSLVGSRGLFLRLLYEAGIKGYYDGLAVHFYTLTLAAIRNFRSVQLSYGDSTPLWLDEFGWTSCYPQQKIQEEQACVTPAVQAQNVTNVYRALSRTSYVAAVTLFALRDGGGEKFGVLSERGTRKPSFRALAGVLASPFGSQSPVTLSLRRARGHVIARGAGPVGDYMQLEVLKAGVLRYRASFTLNRLNRYSIVLPSVLGTRGLRVRVYQEWGGRGKAAQRSI